MWFSDIFLFYACMTSLYERNFDNVFFRVMFAVLNKCDINGFHFSSPNRPHLSVGIQKISPLQPCFFIGSENVCSRGWRLLQVFRLLWDVWQRMCAAEVCRSWMSYIKFPRDKKKCKPTEELWGALLHNKGAKKKATVLFFSDAHVHGAALCSRFAQLHNCRFVSPAACVVSPPRLDGEVLPSLVFPLDSCFKVFAQCWKRSEASVLTKPVVLQVVLIRDPSKFLFLFLPLDLHISLLLSNAARFPVIMSWWKT